MSDLLHRGLRTEFPISGGTFAAVDGVDLAVRVGARWGSSGESGCGKSMLSLSVMRLVPPPGRVSAGQVVFDGQDLLGLPMAAMRGAARPAHRDDLPGADDQPEPGLHRRRPDHGGDARA